MLKDKQAISSTSSRPTSPFVDLNLARGNATTNPMQNRQFPLQLKIESLKGQMTNRENDGIHTIKTCLL